MKSGIYKITCLESGKVYIGSSVDVDKRKNTHLCELRNNYHPNRHLQNSYNLYGESKFVFEVVAYCQPEMLLSEEERYIQIFDSYNNGYNLVEKPTHNNLGLKHTEESKEKMSVSAKKRGRNTGMAAHLINLIRQEFYEGARAGDLAKKFKLSRGAITKIVELRSYRDVPVKIDGYEEFIKQKQEDFKNGKRPRSTGWNHTDEFIERFRKSVSKPKKYLRRLTDQDILDIRKKKAEGSTCKDLSEQYGVNQNTISRIVRKLIYKDIEEQNG